MTHDAHKHPNILFAFADDWGRYASVYAKHHGPKSLSALIDTPCIDRIANEGALFTNAHVPAPSCTPCRSSVLSGRYFWQTRLAAILQGAVWDDGIPTWGRMLEEEGYHTGTTYKVWGPGQPAYKEPYCDTAYNYNAAGRAFNSFSFQAYDRVQNEGQSVEEAKQPLYDEVRQNFQHFLADAKEDQPWCYWWGPTNTHRKWQRGSGKVLWDIEPDDLEGRMPEFFPDEPLVREDVADYLGECMAVDRGLDVILQEIEKRGELDNTFIVVSGDHGIPGFPRAKCNLYDIGSEVSLMMRLPGAIAAGQVIEDMTNIMDVAPTFVEAAGLAPDPGMTAQSLWPRLSGDAAAKSAQDNWVMTGRERHVAQARDWNLPYPQRALRTAEYLYVHNFEPDRWPMGDPKGLDDLNAPAPEFESLEHETFVAYPDMDAGPTKAWMIHHRAEAQHTDNFQLGFGKRPQEELYDIVNDPHQMRNLASDPAHRQVATALREKLMTELVRQSDPRVVEETCRFEASPYTDGPDEPNSFERGQDPSQVDGLNRLQERLSRSGEERPASSSAATT